MLRVLRHVGCCWLKFEDGQIWANNTQHVATRRNMVAKRTQHVAPNNVAMCCVDMLRSFGRGLRTKFTRHVMHRARALSSKVNNNRANGHCYNFAWFNDLGRSVTPIFLSKDHFSTDFLRFSKNWRKSMSRSLNLLQNALSNSVHLTSSFCFAAVSNASWGLRFVKMMPIFEIINATD